MNDGKPPPPRHDARYYESNAPFLFHQIYKHKCYQGSMALNIARLCSVCVYVFCPVIYLYLAGNTRDTVNTQPANWVQINTEI